MKRIGIVGIGGFAAEHLRNILTLEAEGLTRLEGAVIRNPAKYPETVAQLRQGGRAIYASLTDMLEHARGRINIISLPVGVPYHRDMAIQALEAGCDVILEKPSAATVQDVDALVETQQRTGHFCVIGYQLVHTPSIQMLREEIERGRLGKIKRIKCYALWPRDWHAYYKRNPWAGQLIVDGQWVLDGPCSHACSHYLNNMLYLLNIENGGEVGIESLRAELYRANAIPSHETVCLRARISSGAELFMTVSLAVNTTQDPIMEIEAEKAAVMWTMDNAKAVIHYRDGTVRTVETPGPTAILVYRDALAAAEGSLPRPLFIVGEDRLQVLASNLAFESSEGIVTIPEQCREVIPQANNDYRVVVKGLEEIIWQAYCEARLFSELGVPWATSPTEVSGASYTEFPRSAKLRAYLQDVLEGYWTP